LLCSSTKSYLKCRGQELFTLLESPSIGAGDGGNRKHQLLIEGGVQALPFLTGFTFPRLTNLNQMSEYNQKLSHYELPQSFFKNFPF
jgi:hypothetical protein